MLNAAVASGDPKRSGQLRTVLQQTGLVELVTEWNVSAGQQPKLGESVPPVVLMDLTHNVEGAFALAAQVKRVDPMACVIACSYEQQPSPELLMRAMRSGVQEFLSLPLDPMALRSTLARLMEERGTGKPESLEKLIVVTGAKGGVGATTVAVNLGVQLATLTQERAVLMDFGRPFGHDSLLLDLEPRFTLRDAVDNLERLDGHFFNGLLTRHNSGLEVLAGLPDPDEWNQIPVSALTRVVNIAQSTCSYPVLDLGSTYSSEWGTIFRLARYVIMVAQTDVPCLWTLERRISAMTALGLDADRFRIVINRWHRSDEEALQTFEKKSKRPIFARLPNDFRQVSEAVNSGLPLSRNHADPLGSKFRELAIRISGVKPVAKPKRPSILGLFSETRRS